MATTTHIVKPDVSDIVTFALKRAGKLSIALPPGGRISCEYNALEENEHIRIVLPDLSEYGITFITEQK